MLAVSNHQTLQPFKARRPVLDQVSFVAPNASVIGDVSIGQSSSIWYGAILRGMPFSQQHLLSRYHF